MREPKGKQKRCKQRARVRLELRLIIGAEIFFGWRVQGLGLVWKKKFPLVVDSATRLLDACFGAISWYLSVLRDGDEAI